jgi:type I restriction enzyme M protein
MIDASSGYLKDGNKNRLRDMDLHKIVDVFNKCTEVPKILPNGECRGDREKRLQSQHPRYIDSQEAEDIQDIEAHLRGGIPIRDVDALQPYWDVCPQLRQSLFVTNREGYLDLAVSKSAIKPTIYEHPEFVTFTRSMNALFEEWKNRSAQTLKNLTLGCHPKTIIADLAEELLEHYSAKPLIDQYDVYQHLMDYWGETMQDDVYLIAVDGWIAQTSRIIETDKKGKVKDKGWTCDLIPKALIVNRYFSAEQEAITQLTAELESLTARLAELEEEHGGEEGAFSDLDKVNKAEVAKQLKKIKGDKSAKEEFDILSAWLELNTAEADLKKALKTAEIELDVLSYAKYPTLSVEEIKTLVVEDKWLTTISSAIHGEMDRISQALTQRVKELSERYESPLPKLTSEVEILSARVEEHLRKMGFVV